jgi:hypothetical protein
MKKIWKCPKCKRIFKRAKQQHSCISYPIEKHFERKEYAKELYGNLKKIVQKRVGSFRVESLPCCIHFVTKGAYTFAAVFVLKDRIRLHIASEELPKSDRVKKSSKISSMRYLYSIDIKNKDEIDAEFIGRIKQSFHSVN